LRWHLKDKLVYLETSFCYEIDSMFRTGVLQFLLFLSSWHFSPRLGQSKRTYHSSLGCGLTWAALCSLRGCGYYLHIGSLGSYMCHISPFSESCGTTRDGQAYPTKGVILDAALPSLLRTHFHHTNKYPHFLVLNPLFVPF